MKKLLLVLALFSLPLVAKEREPITQYQVFFSPRDHVAEELISMIDKERKSIRAAVYSLAHRGVMKALMQAKQRGVDVEVIVDPTSIQAKSLFRKQSPFPLTVFVWDPPVESKQLSNGKVIRRKKSLMHYKFCVFGDNRVWTGSFNFTQAASHSHRENVFAFESKEVATRYLDEFSQLKSEGCVPLATYLGKQ
jgi:phosphatidylserine/phosphatidylglycerophosphate/cardiolipin synthase-like enzyme